MIYIIVEDFGYDGSGNIWAGTNIVQCFDKVKTAKCMSMVEDEYYDLCVQVFDLSGKMIQNVYLVPKNVVSLEAFKEVLAKE